MRIKEILEDKNITQVALAKKLKWSPQKLHSRLNKPSCETIILIAKAIPCEIQELFETSNEYAHWYVGGEWLGIRKKH